MIADGQVYRIGGANFAALIPADASIGASVATVEESGVRLRSAYVEVPREAADVDAALRLAGVRLAR